LITGAYHDLGMMYIADYKTATGWQSFRLAHRICPSHPLMMEISEMERKLESDFQEFF